MKSEETISIEIVEKLMTHLLAVEPQIEKEFALLRSNRFEPQSHDYYLENVIAAEFGIDIYHSAGRRKSRSIMKSVCNEISETAGNVCETAGFVADSNYRITRNTLRSIRNYEKNFKNNSLSLRSDKFFDELNKQTSLPSALKFVEKKFPSLKGNRKFRFLQNIGYKTSVPDRNKIVLLKRLGLFSETGNADADCLQYHNVCYNLSSASRENIAVIDLVFGYYSGSQKFAGNSLGVCIKNPHCNECVVKKFCLYHKLSPSVTETHGKSEKKKLPDELPREKLSRRGAEHLSETELLAILIRTGSGKYTFLDLANKLRDRFKSLSDIASASLSELSSIQGIGLTKAIEIKAAFELGKRLLAELSKPKTKITNSKDVFDIFQYRMINLKEEHFYIIMLDSKNKIIAEKLISKGSLSSTIVHPREAFKEAIRESASSVVFIHNHPSGDPSPSKDDERITVRLKEAGEIIGINVIDHIIIGSDRFYSFNDSSDVF